ncbi:MAG: hypothetical protein U0900_22825 [Myxococcota bacterium]
MIDPWIVGDSPESGRTYVVHCVEPRFVIEIHELSEADWDFGALVWLDRVSTEDATFWSQQAAHIYFQWVIRCPDGPPRGH